MDADTRRLLIAVQFCFGVFPLLGKLAMEAFEPRAVLVWRLAVGSLALGLLVWKRHGRRMLPARRDLLPLFFLSLLGITLNQLMFLEGLSRSTAVNAGLIMCIIPVVTCALAVLLGQESLTGRRGLGIGCAVAGVAWLFVGRGASLADSTLTGDVLMTLNCICYSVYLVLAKPLVARMPQDVVLAWVFFFGLITAPWFALDVDWIATSAEPLHWWSLAGVLLFPTVLAYLGNIVVLARTTASNTAAYVLLQPIIAAGLGITVLGERPEPALIVTVVGVLVGLWLVSVPRRRSLATTR
jgi:drug/metabolite transporter (DMT)-like permease